jgi:hypothetical protein
MAAKCSEAGFGGVGRLDMIRAIAQRC